MGQINTPEGRNALLEMIGNALPTPLAPPAVVAAREAQRMINESIRQAVWHELHQNRFMEKLVSHCYLVIDPTRAGWLRYDTQLRFVADPGDLDSNHYLFVGKMTVAEMNLAVQAKWGEFLHICKPFTLYYPETCPDWHIRIIYPLYERWRDREYDTFEGVG